MDKILWNYCGGKHHLCIPRKRRLFLHWDLQDEWGRVQFRTFQQLFIEVSYMLGIPGWALVLRQNYRASQGPSGSSQLSCGKWRPQSERACYLVKRQSSQGKVSFATLFNIICFLRQSVWSQLLCFAHIMAAAFSEENARELEITKICAKIW